MRDTIGAPATHPGSRNVCSSSIFSSLSALPCISTSFASLEMGSSSPGSFMFASLSVHFPLSSVIDGRCCVSEFVCLLVYFVSESDHILQVRRYVYAWMFSFFSTRCGRSTLRSTRTFAGADTWISVLSQPRELGRMLGRLDK